MSGDLYFNSVKLLLHMDGSNGSTTFTDVTGNTVTPSGNAQISTAQSKFGGASGLFDGNGDYLTVTSSTLALNSGEFTAEGWVYLTALSAVSGFFFNGTTSANTHRIQVSCATDGSVSFYLEGTGSNAGVNSAVGAISTNAWHHIAAVRDSSNQLRLYVNGNSVGTPVTQSFSISQSNTFYVGLSRSSSTLRYPTGYIDDFRVTKLCRYAANFSIPTAAFPDSLPIERAAQVAQFKNRAAFVNNRIRYQGL